MSKDVAALRAEVEWMREVLRANGIEGSLAHTWYVRGYEWKAAILGQRRVEQKIEQLSGSLEGKEGQ